MVALVDASSTDAFRAAVLDSYHGATGVQAEVYTVEAAQGAGLFQ
jgi:galactokinase